MTSLHSVTHSDIDLCRASPCLCVCVCACTRIPAIIGIQISSHKCIQLLPFFNQRSQSQGPNRMMGNKLKRMALIAHIQINKWRWFKAHSDKAGGNGGIGEDLGWSERTEVMERSDSGWARSRGGVNHICYWTCRGSLANSCCRSVTSTKPCTLHKHRALTVCVCACVCVPQVGLSDTLWSLFAFLLPLFLFSAFLALSFNLSLSLQSRAKCSSFTLYLLELYLPIHTINLCI